MAAMTRLSPRDDCVKVSIKRGRSPEKILSEFATFEAEKACKKRRALLFIASTIGTFLVSLVAAFDGAV
jgi:hypothetical protein